MPQQFGTLLKLLTDKIGIDTSDKAFTDLLSINAQVSDEAFNKLKTGLDRLMSEAAAKTNSELHRHFKALTLAPVDKFLNEQLEALGFDDDFKAEFKANNNSYDKIKKLLAKTIEAEAAKRTGNENSRAQLQAEIDRLNAEVLQVRQAAETDKQQLQTQSENTVLNYAVEAALENRRYANENLPKRENTLTAKTLLQQELELKNARLARTADGQLKIVCSNNPDLDYSENSKPVTFGDFVDNLLAKHNMLKVSDLPRADKTQLQKPFVSIPGDQANEAVLASNNANLQNLERALS